MVLRVSVARVSCSVPVSRPVDEMALGGDVTVHIDLVVGRQVHGLPLAAAARADPFERAVGQEPERAVGPLDDRLVQGPLGAGDVGRRRTSSCRAGPGSRRRSRPRASPRPRRRCGGRTGRCVAETVWISPIRYRAVSTRWQPISSRISRGIVRR